MNILKNKNKILAFLLAGILLFSHSVPLYASGSFSQSETAQQKADSTKIATDKSQVQPTKAVAEKIQSTKPTSNYAYNFIYYLISKFIQTNPLYKQR